MHSTLQISPNINLRRALLHRKTKERWVSKMIFKAGKEDNSQGTHIVFSIYYKL